MMLVFKTWETWFLCIGVKKWVGRLALENAHEGN